MTSFLPTFGLVYVAVALLASAAVHVARPAAFRRLLAAHGIVPRRLAGAVALAVPAFELAAGALALLLVARERADGAAAALLCAATALAGVGFVAYVRRLLATRAPIGCGCTPLAGPTTTASLVPGAALAAVSALALAAGGLGPDASAGPLVLPVLWGGTLAVLAMLLPATMPSP